MHTVKLNGYAHREVHTTINTEIYGIMISYLMMRDLYEENDLTPGFCRAGRVLMANFHPL